MQFPFVLPSPQLGLVCRISTRPEVVAHGLLFSVKRPDHPRKPLDLDISTCHARSVIALAERVPRKPFPYALLS